MKDDTAGTLWNGWRPSPAVAGRRQGSWLAARAPALARPADGLESAGDGRVPRPAHGRRFSAHRRVRLSDAGRDGVLRLDGWPASSKTSPATTGLSPGLDPEDTWVVRRTAVRTAEGGRWPALGEGVALTTWCSGAGAAWAERRTDLEWTAA